MPSPFRIFVARREMQVIADSLWAGGVLLPATAPITLSVDSRFVGTFEILRGSGFPTPGRRLLWIQPRIGGVGQATS